jgi:hypothetical protein
MRFLTSGFLHESVSLKFPAQGATSVALTPVAILPPVSTNQRYRRENLSPVLLIPVEHDLGVSPRIFEKIQNVPNVIFRGMGAEVGIDTCK